MKRDTNAERTTQRTDRTLGDAETDELLDTMVMDVPPMTADLANASMTPDMEVPERRYLIRKRLGLGGMGEVSDTFDVKIGREIAMKKLLRLDPRDDAELEQRFLREARIQALLEHPAIVPVYDIGYGEDGVPWFTMKRVRGQTLSQLLEQERNVRQSMRNKGRHRLLSSFVTVCLAMEYAHQRGVIHRDLKPDNIMLGAHGEVYILDWGLAKVLSIDTLATPSRGVDTYTKPGEMVGTPGYMPPEQVLGQHTEVDARSDVYALGAMLFEILTCSKRHTGIDMASILDSTMNPSVAPPTPPPDAPPELCRLALEATSFLRKERPGSARALADAIERYLDGDRDEDLRRKLADGKANVAHRELEKAAYAPPEQREHLRAAAMQHAGAALALVPEHKEASSLVFDLLRQPPANSPPAVRRELEALDRTHLDAAMRDNAVRIASWVLFGPLLLLLPIKHVGYVAALLLVLIICGATSVFLWKKKVEPIGARVALLAATSVLFAMTSGLFGPFIIVPVLVASNTLLFGAQLPRKHRPLIVGLGLASFFVPLFLELVGVVGHSFEFTDGRMILLPRVIEFSAAGTTAALTVATAFGIVMPTYFTSRLRDALRHAEKQLVIQKWQLYQLSPARSLQQ